jgi:hypothetical protein
MTRPDKTDLTRQHEIDNTGFANKIIAHFHLRVLHLKVYEDGVLMPFIMSASSSYARMIIAWQQEKHVAVFELLVKQFGPSAYSSSSAQESSTPAQQGLHFVWAQFARLNMKLNPEQERSVCMLLNVYNCTHAIGDSIKLYNLRCRDFFRDPAAQVA